MKPLTLKVTDAVIVANHLMLSESPTCSANAFYLKVARALFIKLSITDLVNLLMGYHVIMSPAN